MNEDTLLKLVDKLAEKLGVAAEQLTPLALETVRQYQLRAMVGAIAGALMLLALPLFLTAALRHLAAGFAANAKRDYRAEGLACMRAVTYGALALLCLVGGAGLLCNGLAGWLAPLPSILGL